jgi:hypothetical protein
MLEGCRLRSTVAVYRDLALDQIITDYNIPLSASPSVLDDEQHTTVHNLTTGTRVLLNLSTASHDPTIFPDPETVKLDRPLDSYIHYGWGSHQCIGMEASRAALTAMFKVVVGLKGLRRAPGPRGVIKGIPAKVWNGQVGNEMGMKDGEDELAGLKVYMSADQSSFSPLPSTMRVRWDA